MIDATIPSFQRWRPLMDKLATAVHADWWESAGLAETAAARLSRNPRARRTLSLHLDWLGEDRDSDVWPDWSEWDGNERRRALVPEKELTRCGLRLGASLFRARMALLVLGRDVGALKSRIGQDAYFFGLRQGKLLKDIAELSAGKAETGDLAESIIHAGMLAIAAWVETLPDNLGARTTLMFPRALAAAESEIAEWTTLERAKWRGALNRIFITTIGTA